MTPTLGSIVYFLPEGFEQNSNPLKLSQGRFLLRDDTVIAVTVPDRDLPIQYIEAERCRFSRPEAERLRDETLASRPVHVVRVTSRKHKLFSALADLLGTPRETGSDPSWRVPRTLLGAVVDVVRPALEANHRVGPFIWEHGIDRVQMVEAVVTISEHAVRVSWHDPLSSNRDTDLLRLHVPLPPVVSWWPVGRAWPPSERSKPVWWPEGVCWPPPEDKPSNWPAHLAFPPPIK